MRQLAVVGVVLTAIFMSGCSNSEKSDNRQEASPTTSTEVVPGYGGGCKTGFTIWTQNQFTGADGGYGALVRSALSDPSGHSAGLFGNNKLLATGWLKTEKMLYENNPVGIRGEVWYYIPQLPNGGAGWVADAGVRAVETEPAPGDESSYFTPDQTAPQPSECKLTP